MNKDYNNWIIKGESVEYENPWIKVTEYQVINPSGKEGIYGKVHYKNIAIGILPIDADGSIYMVGQFRFPLNKYSIEIPEGGGDLGIDPLESAKRELKEETGLIAAHWEKILEMHLSNSVSDEHAIVYLATRLIQEEPEPEETEKLTITKMNIDEAYQMIIEHKITDSITVAAIMRLKIMMLENNWVR
ncbi:MAG: NUDIX domain-containing protein [bacterium]